ncbi:unnamed protein product [Cyclocybe aegerita]|uniref:F-box domain-containing protein n=1 Tax=Cyclocybe aegerita TaxID=1973307 RepID=A0A8S0XNF8_CYCAE|nr:unnamed protein product [Cyclocybe aegerita]
MGVLSKPLPLEIWMLIVKLLKPNTKANAKALRALSRCCRALALPSQRVLFNDLHIPRTCTVLPSRRAGALARLKDAFTRSPHLATFVRRVCYVIEDPDSDSENTTLHWILNQLTGNLSGVQVEYISKTPSAPYLDWDTLDARLRSSIMHTVQAPRLESLSLLWIKNLPLSGLVSLSPDLTRVKLEVKIQQESVERSESLNSNGTPRRMDPTQNNKRRLPQIMDFQYYDHDMDGVLASRPFVFDFEQLQFLQISWGNELQCAMGKELIKASSKLEGLACKSIAGLAKAMLDCSSEHSLTTLAIRLSHETASQTVPDPDEYDLFLGFIEELEFLAGKNAVKYLMVHFDTTKEAHDRLTSCLSRFDEVITREAFPHLEHFELEIWVHYSEPYYVPHGSRLEDSWAERNRAQCRGVSAIPGLKFGCQVEIMLKCDL